MRVMRFSARIRRFKGLYTGRRCFVIGNGPSLKSQDLSRLSGEVSLASNLFVLHPQFPRIRLKYLCLSDPKFWDSGALEPSIDYAIQQHQELRVFVESDIVRHKRNWRMFPQERTFIYRLDKTHTVYDGHFSLDPSRCTNHGHTVIIDIAIPLALYMGCTEIYMLGCDCDYRLSEAPDHGAGYFYDIASQQSRIGDLGYLQNYWPKYVFDSYAVVRQRVEEGGRRIFNATAGGKLEVFPRVEYDSLF